MAQGNGGELPILVVGGGIGGLVAAHALARKGFPVRVLEQAPEFKEIGAGIQLGPNIFRALEQIGLKDAVLADAWRPTGLEMRCALSGDVITRLPLGEDFAKFFGQPYAVTHRADIHAAYLNACLANNLITLETQRHAQDFEDDGASVTVTLQSGERIRGRALIGCDGMWSGIRDKIVADGKPRVSGHIAYRAVLKRDDVPEDLWRPDMVLWAGPRTHFVHYPLRRGELYNLVAVFHSDKYVEGWNAEADPEELFARFKVQGPATGSLAHARTHRDLAHVGVVRPRTGQGVVEGPCHAVGGCRPPDAAISRSGRLHGDRGRRVARGQGRGPAGRPAGGV
jgi:salicylate hydroxylase